MKFLSTAIFASALIFSCSSDDDSTPEPVLEEEVITTMTITLHSGWTSRCYITNSGFRRRWT